MTMKSPWTTAARSSAATGLLTVAAVRSLDGLTGSEDPEDARALVELARRAREALAALDLLPPTPNTLLPRTPDTSDRPHAPSPSAATNAPVPPAPGTRVRAIARLVPAGHPRVALLAVRLPTGRYDLGLDRLQRQDVTPTTPPQVTPAGTRAHALRPLHILRRRTEQVVVAGRRALTHTAPAAGPHTTAPDAALLRRAGLSTAAELLDAMRRSAAERGRDGFGRLVPADTDAFARAWLATARYLDEGSAALCRGAWQT
ncbi:hypothetical protein [Streptomyces sp. NPDC055400]